MDRSKIFNDVTVSNSQVSRETKSLSYDSLIKDEFFRRSGLRFSLVKFVYKLPSIALSIVIFLSFFSSWLEHSRVSQWTTREYGGKKLRSNLVPLPVILAMNRVAMFEHVAAFPCVRP